VRARHPERREGTLNGVVTKEEKPSLSIIFPPLVMMLTARRLPNTLFKRKLTEGEKT
jgi:hypothetical protein